MCTIGMESLKASDMPHLLTQHSVILRLYRILIHALHRELDFVSIFKNCVLTEH